MSTACVFCIGTFHSHNEDENVLVKLWNNCRFNDLGVEGNHGRLDSSGLRIETPNRVHPQNGGWKWINDGQDGLATGMNDQIKANADLILSLSVPPRRVVLVGHSRGALLCISIASTLYQRLGAQSPECHLFLYDPVQMTWKGDGQLHPNVVNVRLIVMEDDGSWKFPLMAVTRDGQGEYLRLPGTHGTATQVSGHPIGQLGYMLALEWLGKCDVSMRGGPDLSDRGFCREYARINRVNPVLNDGTRKINDTGETSGWKTAKVGARNETLDPKLGSNPYQGSGFFINDDHRKRFQRQYPALAASLRERSGEIRGRRLAEPMERQYLAEQDRNRLRQDDPYGYRLVCEWER